MKHNCITDWECEGEWNLMMLAVIDRSFEDVHCGRMQSHTALLAARPLSFFRLEKLLWENICFLERRVRRISDFSENYVTIY
jgi:hypothetical protein